MQNMISVPLHEYEELVRDSEKLRIITENAIRVRRYRPTMEVNFVLLVSGYQESETVVPAQRIHPDKRDSVPSASMAISDALKEAFIDGAFPEPIAKELKKQIGEKKG